MKGILTLSVALCMCLSSSTALGQMDYDKLLAYTVDATESSMRQTLTYVALEKSSAHPNDVRRAAANTVLYTTSLDVATLNTLAFLDVPEEPVEPVEPATAGSNPCGFLTLPEKCNTSSPPCFSVSGGVCTNNDICMSQNALACTFLRLDCDEPATLPPACDPMTRIQNCTQGTDDCGAFTIFPKCTAAPKQACLTSGGDNCDTAHWLCQRATFKPACQDGHDTFLPPPAVCPTIAPPCSGQGTYNWDCFNTQNSLCSTSATDCYTAKNGNACDTSSPPECAVTRGIPCKVTLSLFCLTFKGKICPNGPDVPNGLPEESLIVLTVLAVSMVGAVTTKRQ